jgi:hypothetical protein
MIVRSMLRFVFDLVAFDVRDFGLCSLSVFGFVVRVFDACIASEFELFYF